MELFDFVLGLFKHDDSTSRTAGTAEVSETPEASNALARANAIAVATPEELQLTQSVVQLIERDEGDVLHAYPDPATGGEPWTIGYGHTGSDVHPGLVITQAQAEALLQQDLATFKQGIEARLAGHATNDNQFSAMVSFSYNVGLGNFDKSSVKRFHLAGQYQQAADAFLMWDMAAGQVMPGLVRRRRQEREAYLGLVIEP